MKKPLPPSSRKLILCEDLHSSKEWRRAKEELFECTGSKTIQSAIEEATSKVRFNVFTAIMRSILLDYKGKWFNLPLKNKDYYYHKASSDEAKPKVYKFKLNFGANNYGKYHEEDYEKTSEDREWNENYLYEEEEEENYSEEEKDDIDFVYPKQYYDEKFKEDWGEYYQPIYPQMDFYPYHHLPMAKYYNDMCLNGLMTITLSHFMRPKRRGGRCCASFSHRMTSSYSSVPRIHSSSNSDVENTLMLLAIAAASFFLSNFIQGNQKKKRRKRSIKTSLLERLAKLHDQLEAV